MILKVSFCDGVSDLPQPNISLLQVLSLGFLFKDVTDFKKLKKKHCVFQDKTFGLKNKKGAKQQKFIKNVTQQVKHGQQSARQVRGQLLLYPLFWHSLLGLWFSLNLSADQTFLWLCLIYPYFASFSSCFEVILNVNFKSKKQQIEFFN